MDTTPENDYDAYREEYVRKFWEKKNKERAARQQRDNITYRVFRTLAFPIAFFAILLVSDEWLPLNTLTEPVINGWQRSVGKRHGLISYMRTESFLLEVPHQAHLKYPYSDKGRPPLVIEVTPIFHVPLSAKYTTDGMQYSFEILNTIFNMFLPLRWTLLISSLYICYAKEYTKYSWSFVFLPTIVFLIICVVLSN